MFFGQDGFNLRFETLEDNLQHDFTGIADEGDSSVIAAVLQLALLS